MKGAPSLRSSAFVEATVDRSVVPGCCCRLRGVRHVQEGTPGGDLGAASHLTGGLLLHVRIHPPTEDAFDWLPVAFGVLGAFVVPVLFDYRPTAVWAFLLTFAGVVIGTITMAYYSVTHWQGPVTWDAVLLKSTLADIVILTAKLPLAVSIQRYWRRTQPQPGNAD